MKINLVRTWFAPTDKVNVDSIHTRSGMRYREGEQIVPDHLYPFLPSDAEILEPPKDIDFGDQEFPKLVRDLDKNKEDVSVEKRAFDQVAEAHKRVDEVLAKQAAIKRKRAAILKKARAAKAAKKAAREAAATQE